MPILLALPPTSLKPYSDFINASFVTRRRPTYASVVQIGLKRVENGSNLYSVATFKKLYDFTGEQLAQVKAYATDFRAQIKEMLKQRAETLANADPDTLYDDDSGYTTTENGSHFVISSNDVIDGDRDALPM